MMMFVLLQNAAPTQQRLKAAIDEFNRSISTETLVVSAVVLLIALVWLYALKRAYQAWFMRKHGFHDSYLRKRKKFDD